MQRYQKDILAVFIPQRAGPLGARKYLLAVDPRNGGVIGAASIWRQHGPLGSLTGSVSTRRAQPGTGSVRPRPAAQFTLLARLETSLRHPWRSRIVTMGRI